MSIEDLEKILKKPESPNLEFKLAQYTFSENTDLIDYVAAIANEQGGKLILGVNNLGQIVGTNVYKTTLNKIQINLYQKLRLKVVAEEIIHPKGRVIIFNIPSRPVGALIKSTGNYTYPMRVGESLTEMDIATMKSILNENEPDLSDQIVDDLTINDLDVEAIKLLKKLWSDKSNRPDFLELTDEQSLNNLGLIKEGKITRSALILLGKKEVIDKILPGAEIIFEWRQDGSKIPYDYRTSWREPFIKIFDNVWDVINARNISMSFQSGFVQRSIWAFDKKSIREALLNAVAHRDYSYANRSIFIKASPDSFYIESPGGFVPPVTTDNILTKSVWRNRKLAETLEKAGLVERSGQGIDDIYEKTIRDGKGSPNFEESDTTTVKLQIPAKIEDPKFITYLDKIAEEKSLKLSVQEIYELENVRRAQIIRDTEHKEKFIQLGIIEKHGRGLGTRYILSHRYYQHEGKPGIHTRLVGTTREEKKLLILKHLKKNKKGFMKDFLDAFPDLRSKDIGNMLQELRKKDLISYKGHVKQGWWEEVTKTK